MSACEIQTEEEGHKPGEKQVVPETFFCPISHSIMKDPVIVHGSGQTYERSQIEEWFEDHSVDPLTNVKLFNKSLIPNIALRNTIDDFKMRNRPINSWISNIDFSNGVVNDYTMNQSKQSYKVSVVGGCNVGKTTLIRKMCYDQFDFIGVTVAIDIEVVVVRIGHTYVKLYFWDTAGGEVFESLASNCVRGANAILTAFDLSRPKETLKIAKKYLLIAPSDKALLFLVGTKADWLKNEMEMRAAISMGQRFADNNSMIFFETSAKDETNIKELLLSLSRSLLAMEKNRNAFEDQQNTHAREDFGELIQLESNPARGCNCCAT